MMRPFFLPMFALLSAGLAFADGVESPVADVAGIRGLSREEAAKHLPVKLRGVVTMAFPRENGSFIVDDGRYGIFVNRSNGKLVPGQTDGELKVGTLVEIEGTTTEAGFARDVVAHQIRWLGNAPLPEARPATMDDLLGGHLDCQRVKVSGVVKFLERRTSAPRIRLMLGTQGGRKLPLMLMDVSEEQARKLLDTEVEATGVATSFFNERGELIGVTVQVQDAGGIVVKSAAPAEGAVPARSLEVLNQFNPEQPSLQRVKVAGIVTFCRPGEFFYLQEGGRSVRVEPRDGAEPKPGDRVEVLGYPEVKSYFAEISGAEVKKTGKAVIPEPVEASRQDILRRWQPADSPGGLDGKRVKIRARLDKIESLPERGRRLFLNHQSYTVFADLPAKQSDENEPQPGSELEVCGICVIELNTSWPAVDWTVPGDFHLLVQEGNDIRVIRPAPWWTPGRIWTALSVAAVTAAAAAGWVVVLRRQVRSQTETIRMQSVRETLAEERSRMAREFHDTLEQELTGLAIQLDAASDSLPAHPAQAAKALENAYTLLSYTRTETRRSIWDLRAMALQEHGLFGALQLIAEQLEGSGVPKIEMRCEGTARRLEARVETNLLRIGSECLTNAIKHANA
ncbi:MAG TPA: histidine kinase, partial [Luteolibacter sp.]|nr:histidine kinase [Luteolibacter sp.]